MKKYEFVRMFYRAKRVPVSECTYTGRKDSSGNEQTHVDVIKDMALQGWRYIDRITVHIENGIIYSYDLVFEKDV